MTARLLLPFIITLISVTGAYSQDVRVSVSAPTAATVGEQIKVTWTVNSNDGVFTAPSFDGFYVVMGPMNSFSQSFSNMSGRMEREIVNTYTYYLQTLAEGKATIKPATYNTKRQSYQSDSVIVTVSKTAPLGQSDAAVASSAATAGGEPTFIRIIPEATSVYVGEALPLAVKLYTRQSIDGIGEEIVPDFKGFMKEDITIPPLERLVEESVSGTTYGTGIYRRFIVYAQSAGKQVISPLRLTAYVRQQRNFGGGGFFDDPFFSDALGSMMQVPLKMATPSLSIDVKPLPLPAPESFSGAVGEFKIKVGITSGDVKMNEAFTLTISIKGKGNLRLAGTPNLKLPAGFESYDPKNSIIPDKSYPNGIAGEKIFEYLIIPRAAGEFLVGAIDYSFFNPTSGKYETVSAAPLNVKVSESADGGDSSVAMLRAPLKSDVAILAKDVRYIKEKERRIKDPDSFIISGLLYFLLFPSIIVLAIGLYLTIKWKQRRRGDLVSLRQRRAVRHALKRLDHAAKLDSKDNATQFYDMILQSLWGYLSDKLRIPLSKLNRTSALQTLEASGLPDSSLRQLESVLDICEFSRYASRTASTDHTDLMENVRQLIISLDEAL